MEAPGNPRWYLLHCKPQQQSRAQWHLDNQDFVCFNPTHAVQRKYRRRTCTVDEPLFPNYLFIRLEQETDWRALTATRGVLRVVSFNGRPLPVEEQVIEGLRRRCEQCGEPEPLYRPGDHVVVTDGCFRHIEAIVETTRGEDRVILLMNLLHSEQHLEMPAHQLAPA